MVVPWVGKARHFVLRISERTLIKKFYVFVLGMKILRHDELPLPCPSYSNGIYFSKYSRTMVGYGPEETHFALELTYNYYNVSTYRLGNDFIGITIKSREAIARARDVGWPMGKENGIHFIRGPVGYKFYLLDEPQPTDTDPIIKVTLASSNITHTIDYYKNLLFFKVLQNTTNRAVFAYNEEDTKLEFIDIGVSIDRGTTYGRFSVTIPEVAQIDIEFAVFGNLDPKYILHSVTVCVDTPGKPTCTVEVVCDPDDHETSFISIEDFVELSKGDSNAENSLMLNIAKDVQHRAWKRQNATARAVQ